MCGRFTLTINSDTIKLYFGLSEGIVTKPRYNIAPSQPIPIIRNMNPIFNANSSSISIDFLRWGLTPAWMEKQNLPNPRQFINARLETVLEKPAFKAAIKKRRCLIIADGYFEWKPIGRIKQPYYIRRKDKLPFAIAGIWENEGCALLTTSANSKLTPIHDRMPVILLPELHAEWLDEKSDETKIKQMLSTSYPSEFLEFFPVSTKVNSPQFDHPECIISLQ